MLDGQLETFGRDHVDTAATLQNIACLYRDMGRHEESRELFEEVIANQEAAWGPDHPWSMDNLQDYAKLLHAMGEEREAAEIEARIRRIEKA